MFNKSIAIVDNDPNLLNIFSEALKMNGYYDISSSLIQFWHINKYKKIQINIHY
jgi:hypothetical protein